MVVALEHIRRLRGLSQRELAEKAGVSPATVYELEVGKRPTPRPSTLRKLAEALEVEIADLLGEPAVPLAKAPGEAGPPRVSKDRLQEHFEDVRQDEVDYLNWMIADFWRLALPGEKPVARFVPEDIDSDRVWRFLEHALSTHNVFEPEEVERIGRGAMKVALGAGG